MNMMKKAAAAAVLSIVLSLSSVIADGELIESFNFTNSDIRVVLEAIAQKASKPGRSINIIMTPDVQGLVTVSLKGVNWETALDTIIKMYGYGYDWVSDKVLMVSTLDKIVQRGKIEAEALAQREKIGATITQVFFLKYASVASSQLLNEKSAGMSQVSSSISSSSSSTSSSSGTSGSSGSSGTSGGASGYTIPTSYTAPSTITDVIKKLLSKSGSVVEDARTNSLIVTDIPSRMSIIAKTIAELDIYTPQIVLEVEMLDVSKNVIDTIGFKFGQTPLTAVITGATTPSGFPFGSWMSTFTDETTRGSIAINSGTNTYKVQLDFLRKNVDTKILARPRILTINNETAEIKITTNETIGKVTTTSTGGGQTPITTEEAERQDTGVILRVTPQINKDNGEITMFIMPSVRDTVPGELTTISTKDPEERSTRSTVRVKDGETVILGGLIRKEISQTITKLPILGDIPFLGVLFRHKDMPKEKERELIVLITPHIIKDNKIFDKGIARAKELADNVIPGEKAAEDKKALINKKKKNVP
ncbi:MAG: hypothetical protein KJ880_07135 [Candidatus Omnitrophica bacterium]|nr:hypothetical protein [Candidatus Omnitrophota bacterium]MBU1869235.1 hypothetical protein [Candidatus Omnitrophota bacterium]